MEKPKIPIVKKSLMSWIFSANRKLQVVLLLIIVVTVFARVVPLEMQKRVVNEAIRLRKIDLLMLYCGIYLAAVIAASGLKYLINVLETVISQRTTAAMRKELYHHILTLPLSFFRNTQPGSIVNSIVTELTLPGNFVGMAVAVPITNILTLLAFAGYLFWLNWLLAVISLSIYPLVLFLIPLLQKKVNKANQKRVDAARDISSMIAESITGIHEIQSNGAYHIENRRCDGLVDRLLKIRIIWSLYRFAIKVTNNLFTNLGPFLVFILGGYLAIKGQLELGALVAFISAQEKLYTPWKELIEFYQVYQDGAVNYQKTMEFFDVEPEYALEPTGRKPFDLEGSLEVKNLSFDTDDGIHLLDGINLSLKPGEHLALVGFSGSGKSTLALCIGQLYKYTGGQVLLGDKEVSDLTKRDIINTIGFVSQAPFIFQGTIEDNLLYSCRAKTEGDAGGSGRMPTLDERIEVLQQTGIFADVLRFGLNTLIARDRRDELVSRIIRVRKEFQGRFGGSLSDYVEFFNADQYLFHSSVMENLAFGTPLSEDYTENHLLRNGYFLKFLDKADLTTPLLSMGAELSKRAVDILKNLPPDEVFFEQSPIASDELEDYKGLVERMRKRKLHQIAKPDKDRLLLLGLRFTPGVHKMVALPRMLKTLILEGRDLFREIISRDNPGAFAFYRIDEYIFSQTILNNILFGKPKTTLPQAQEKIDQNVIQLLIEEDFLESIIEIGMQFQVGTKGDKLSGGQRQKLAIARAFLKDPKVLIMDEATSALDNKSQARIQNLLETKWRGSSTLVSVVHRLDTIKNYDKVAVMKAGKIVEMGAYDELIEKKGMLYELVFGRA